MVGRLFTTEMAVRQGVTKDALTWGIRKGKWIRVERSVYANGKRPLDETERALALVMATDGVACGTLAARLLKLDSLPFLPPYSIVQPYSGVCRANVQRSVLRGIEVMTVDEVRCTVPLRTLFDLARYLQDDDWEIALESALREKLVSIAEIEAECLRLKPSRVTGLARVKRVLKRRPSGALPTGSPLETRAIQVIRNHTRLPQPQRQWKVETRHGDIVGYLDLAWPEVGLFLELDGRDHENQVQYDSTRQTRAVEATGWRVGRFTWHEVVDLPRLTGKRFTELYNQGLRRTA